MYIPAIILGITGSLHCVGMCSPLAMAVTSSRSLWAKIVYNFGRILSYAGMGSLAAHFGQIALPPAVRVYFSLLLGCVLILIGMGVVSNFTVPFVTSAIGFIITQFKKLFAGFLHHKTNSSVFILGILNGFLPCGISALAITYCLVLPSATEGFFFMILFGLGTWPVMIGLPWFTGMMAKRIRINYQKAMIIAMFASGALLKIGRAHV